MTNISSIEMVAYTNSELPYINSVTLLAKDGREVVLDRSTTEFDFDDEAEILSMFWRDLYIWTGETEDHIVPEELFDGAVVINVDIEDDAPEDYFFELKEFHAAGRSVPVLSAVEQKPVKHGKWIPCGERLPKAFEYIYCTCHSLIDDREDWVIETIYVPQPSDSLYSDWGNIPMLNIGDCEIVAWMHRDIPEPYNGRSEDKMTEQEKATKKHRKEAIETLKEMRDTMMESDNWESLTRLVDAMTMGACAIARLNEIDYGKAESEEE